MAKKPKKTKKLAESPVPQNVAVLDEAGLLTGFETVERGPDWKPATNQVPVPDGCDLAPGRYRWVAPQHAFLPVAPAAPGIEAEPNALRALALDLAARRETAPAESVAWADWYLKSLDAKGGGK